MRLPEPIAVSVRGCGRCTLPGSPRRSARTGWRRTWVRVHRAPRRVAVGARWAARALRRGGSRAQARLRRVVGPRGSEGSAAGWADRVRAGDGGLLRLERAGTALGGAARSGGCGFGVLPGRVRAGSPAEPEGQAGTGVRLVRVLQVHRLHRRTLARRRTGRRRRPAAGVRRDERASRRCRGVRRARRAARAADRQVPADAPRPGPAPCRWCVPAPDPGAGVRHWGAVDRCRIPARAWLARRARDGHDRGRGLAARVVRGADPAPGWARPGRRTAGHRDRSGRGVGDHRRGLGGRDDPGTGRHADRGRADRRRHRCDHPARLRGPGLGHPARAHRRDPGRGRTRPGVVRRRGPAAGRRGRRRGRAGRGLRHAGGAHGTGRTPHPSLLPGGFFEMRSSRPSVCLAQATRSPL